MVSRIYFYIPNLIGYSRIIFAALAFWNKENFQLFFVYYSLSAILDIADGHAARAFNQCTRFGSVLDMVTDRASTSCLIVVLAVFFPKQILWFCFLIALDIMSHFAHVYSSLARGQTSHKTVGEKQNPLLRIYYTNRLVLGGLCAGNEGFFTFCYVLHFWSGPLVAVGPLVPLIKAATSMVTITAAGEIHLIPLMVLLTFPVMAYKQLMNVIQLRQACIDIVALDEQDQADKAATKKR